MENRFSVKGKTALVTGASYGLGITMAEALVGAGANVVIAARSRDKLDALARQLGGNGAAILPLTCDVGDPAQVKAMADAASERFGRVDVLVNNAGVTADVGHPAETLPDELFEQTVRTNLLGTWYCCRELGGRMLADGRGGSVINVASILGMGGQQYMPPAYQASKAGVINLTRNLACTWASRGVRVNAIAPGWFPSEMTAGFLAHPKVLDWVKCQTPMRRVGDPAELSGPLLFLASDASSYVTGATLAVDGGVSASIGCMPFPLARE